MSSYVWSFLGMLLISGSHFRAQNILAGNRDTRKLLNVIAGVAIAYAFIEVFPHLARKQLWVEDLYGGPVVTYLSNHVYLMALLGFCVYVGIRVFSAVEVDRRHSRLAYLALVASMCLYALFVGYMLAEQPLNRPEAAFLFGLAMAAHFLGLHQELMRDRPRLYNRVVRFILIGCTALGWASGIAFDISPLAYALGFSYIAGGVVAAGAINDLPRVKSASALVAFLGGAFVYTLLLLLIEAFRVQT